MRPPAYAVPGSTRFRMLQPLIDGDGACSLVFDVERAAVVEVPEELRHYVAPALDSGNLDEELVGWLAGADLLTSESSWGWSGLEPDAPEPAAGAAEAGGQGASAAAGAAGPTDACEATHGWIDQGDLALALEEVERVFKRGLGSRRLMLHLDRAGNVPAGGWLEAVVADACRRAAAAGQEVGFELTLDPEQVRVETARRLAALPVHVRLRCGESDPLARLGTAQENRPWLLAEPAVRALLDRSALTVQCMLEGPARLIELWRWAKAIGVRSLDVIRLEDSAAARLPGGAWPAVRIREYRQDLHAIFEEICADLESGRTPFEFQPLLRIVRRLRRSEAAATLADDPWEAWEPRGSRQPGSPDAGRPVARVESLDPRLLPEQLWTRLEARGAHPETPRPPCQSCWARQVCSHSAYVASALGKEDPRDPSRERCAYWSAEVEMAVRLFHRLSQIDTIRVMRYFGDAPAVQPARLPRIVAGDLGAKPS